jgi:hypothetical protein
MVTIEVLTWGVAKALHEWEVGMFDMRHVSLSEPFLALNVTLHPPVTIHL